MKDGLELGLLSQAGKVNNLKGRAWMETKNIWRVAFPSILFRVTSFGVAVVTQSFIGHISGVELAAFGLVQTISVRFANGILSGMSSATETLCGQAFGAKRYHMMGICLQRSWIVDLVTATILLPSYIFATPIYKLLGQDYEISVAAGTISVWYISFLYSYVFTTTIQMYLQAQQKNMIIGWLSTSSFLLHLLLSWVFVYKLGWEVHGAMAALALSYWALVFGEFIYIFGGWCPNTWKGFSKAAFDDLLPVVKLSISSGVMLCVQLWYNSVLVLLAGYSVNATVAISAFSICLNISTWAYTICFGFLGAACVRVSNEIGRGNAKAAKFSTILTLCTSCAFGLLFWILYLVFGKEIPYFFTADKEVAEAAAGLHVLLAFTMLLQSIQPVLSGTGTTREFETTCLNPCNQVQSLFFHENIIELLGMAISIKALHLFLSSTSRFPVVVGSLGNLSSLLVSDDHFHLVLNLILIFLLSGVAVGCGSQGKVAIVNICSYYLIGVPVGVLPAYVSDLGIKVTWIGMLCGMLVQAIVLSYLTWKIDWENEVKKASERLNRFLLKSSDDNQNFK
ncbi:hypothetical protein Ancab_033218 [Ancistrocladus abbreviatus]